MIKKAVTHHSLLVTHYGFFQCSIHNFTVACIQRAFQLGIFPDRRLYALVGEGNYIGQRCICQGQRRCAGISTRHIGNGVVDDAVYSIYWVVMRGRPRCFYAASLVYRYVDDYRTLSDGPEQITGYEQRCFAARDQNRSYDNIGPPDFLLYRIMIERQCFNAASEKFVYMLQPLFPFIHNDRINAKPMCDTGGVGPYNTRAKNKRPRWFNSWYTGRQYAAATMDFLEITRTHQGSHPSGDLAHGSKKREGIAFLQRFVAKRTHFFIQQYPGEFVIRCQVQKSKYRLFLTEKPEFGGEGFFYFYDQLRLLKNRVPVGKEGAGGDVFCIGKTAAFASGRFNVYTVSVSHKFCNADWSNADPVFLSLDFPGYAYDH